MDERTPNNQGFGASGAGSANTPPFEGTDINVRREPRSETARELERTRDMVAETAAPVIAEKTQEAITETADRLTHGPMGDQMKDQVKHAAIAMKHDAQDAVKGRAREALGRAEGQANEFLGRAAEGIDTAANRLDSLISEKTAGATGPAARAGDVANRVSDTLHSTADYLRTNDVDGLRTDLERQVRDNPMQTLLIGVAAGWLLGKILR